MPCETIGKWLYKVAYHTALKARTASLKRRRKERQATGARRQEADDPDTSPELRLLLDRELNRLPDRYREPVILCELEGRSRKEAARLLAIPEGTLSSRLAMARKRLARRLARHALALPAGALALSPEAATAAVPVSLVGGTVRMAVMVAAGQAAGAVAAPVAALSKGVLNAMFLSKVKVVVGVLIILLFLGAVATVPLTRAWAWPGTASRKEAKPAEKPKVTVEGEMKKLQGDWKAVAWVEDGEEREEKDGEMEMRIKDSTLRFKYAAGRTEFFSFKLDVTTTPKLFDLVPWEAEFSDKKLVVEGIYSLDGDTLKLCLGLQGVKDRPTAMESKEGSNYILVTLKRVKPEERKTDKPRV